MKSLTNPICHISPDLSSNPICPQTRFIPTFFRRENLTNRRMHSICYIFKYCHYTYGTYHMDHMIWMDSFETSTFKRMRFKNRMPNWTFFQELASDNKNEFYNKLNLCIGEPLYQTSLLSSIGQCSCLGVLRTRKFFDCKQIFHGW